MMVLFLFLTVTVASGLQLTEDQYHSFPRLFHLDDYERCLMKQDGVYCVGTFALTASEDNYTFKLMKEYSKNPSHFNRTRLHRGYCVSERCTPERNSTLRFERCVAKHTQKHSLTARLETAECTTRKQRDEEAKRQPDSTQRLFGTVVFVILLVNVLGTLYDAYSDQNDGSWSLLRCWSIRSSWRKLVAIESIDSPTRSLATIHGVKALGCLITIGIHVMVERNMLFAYHPHFIEEIMKSNFSELMALSVSLLNTFAMISSFLTTYFIITEAEKYNLSLKYLPMAIFSRFFRIFPTYLLLLGFITTWWVGLSNGPLWSSAVVSESETCGKYFWTHAFFVNNFVNSRCLPPSWYLAADFQTNIVVSGLALILPRQGRKAMFIVGTILITTCAVVSTVVYINGWKPVIYQSPESHRHVFSDDASYQNLHLSSWIMLPSCFVGMFCAYLYVELQKKGYQSYNIKWLRAISAFAIPLLVAWMLVCMNIDYSSSPIVESMLEGSKRSIFSIYTGLGLLGMFYYKEQIHAKILSHNLWRTLSRMSLPMMLVHWMVLKTWVGTSMYAVSTTYWILLSDWVVVLVVSYIISIPIALLLEIPARSFLGTLMFRHVKVESQDEHQGLKQKNH